MKLKVNYQNEVSNYELCWCRTQNNNIFGIIVYHVL